MKEDNRPAINNWGLYLLNKVIHPFTVFGTPTFILILVVYLIIHAFNNSAYSGVRSLSGALLPIIIATYIFIFQEELFANLGKLNILVSFFVSLIWGIITMVLIRFFSTPYFDIPINELVLSSVFCILVFGYVSLPHNKVLSYYYGTVSGFLLYIIFWGFPMMNSQ